MVQSFYRRYFQNTTNNVTGAQEDHDRSRYAAYSVNSFAKFLLFLHTHDIYPEDIEYVKAFEVISRRPHPQPLHGFEELADDPVMATCMFLSLVVRGFAKLTIPKNPKKNWIELTPIQTFFGNPSLTWKYTQIIIANNF